MDGIMANDNLSPGATDTAIKLLDRGGDIGETGIVGVRN